MVYVPEKVYGNGQVAILYSPGYGSGWSSWARPEHREMMIFHKAFIEAADAKVKDIEPVLKEVFKTEEYIGGTGGWEDIKIYWIPQGTSFRIGEYDGSEHIEILWTDHSIFRA